MEEVMPKMARWRGHFIAQMRGNPEEDELDPAADIRRCCKKNSFVLSCIGKRTKEDCYRNREVGTVQSERNGNGTVLPRKPKESGKRFRYQVLVTRFSGCALSLQ